MRVRIKKKEESGKNMNALGSIKPKTTTNISASFIIAVE